MEKLDSSKKNQENLEDDSIIYYQKETKELADLLQKGNTNISRKLTRIPFYRLEKLKKIEEEKLKNIHKAEKKKEKDLAKVGKGHDHHQVERRRYKRTKKQKEMIQQNINKEAQKEKEININNKENKMNIKENTKVKIFNNKTEENELDKEKKKSKLNIIPISNTENKETYKINFQNNSNLKEHNNINNKYNTVTRNYSDYFHELKYTPSSIKFSKKELRMSKKQQKIQYPEYTLGHFLSKEDKDKFYEISHGDNMKKKSLIQKKNYNNELNKNIKINSPSEKSEKNKISYLINKPTLKKVNSEKIIINNNYITHDISSDDNKENKKINKIHSLENINGQKDNLNLLENEKNIIKEDIEKENELEKEGEQKKNNHLKLLKKKHKRMNKYKKAILKFRLAKKKAFCEAVEKDNEQLLFSNTFNADESISNVLNQNINSNETMNNNNNIYNNDYSYNPSIISENKNQENNNDKSQINKETNLSNKYSPILSQRKIENNNDKNNPILNYYSYYQESNNITMNSNNNNDTSQKNNYYNNNYINTSPSKNNKTVSFLEGGITFNNNYVQNNSCIYNNQNPNIYINNEIYNYYYPYTFHPLQYNMNNYNYSNNISNINNSSNSNNIINNNINKIETSINNSLPLPKNIFNPEFPSIKLNLKKEKQKDKKLYNYIENLKEENNLLSSLNFDSMNAKQLTSLIKENKDIDKIDLSVINLLLPGEQANSFIKKYVGISKAENIQKQSEKVTKKPIREYVDQILDKNFEKIFSDFIIKLRDIYYKKKSIAPLKAKKRIVVGMREIEKCIKLKNILLLFVVPYIEKIEGIKYSMDQRILDIFENCRKNEIPIFFGLNKFKLGQIARKKISSISMLGIINVEGMENDLKNIIKVGNEMRKKWYLDNYKKREKFIDNKFIKQDNFDYFHNMQMEEEYINNKENKKNDKQ